MWWVFGWMCRHLSPPVTLLPHRHGLLISAPDNANLLPQSAARLEPSLRINYGPFNTPQQ